MPTFEDSVTKNSKSGTDPGIDPGTKKCVDGFGGDPRPSAAQSFPADLSRHPEPHFLIQRFLIQCYGSSALKYNFLVRHVPDRFEASRSRFIKKCFRWMPLKPAGVVCDTIVSASLGWLG